MKINLNLCKVFLTFFMFVSSNLYAQTIETNIQGIVIKDYKCTVYRWVEGNLVNRNGDSFVGVIRVKIIDKENDILWQGVEKISVGGQNGRSFSIEVKVGTCLAPNKVQITLER